MWSPVTDDETVVDSPPASHPTAGEKLRQIRNGSFEHAKRLSDGYIDIPWPRSSRRMAYIAGSCLFAAGGLSTWAYFESSGDTGGFYLVSLVLIVASITIVKHAKFIRDHFENGEEPRYVEDDDD